MSDEKNILNHVAVIPDGNRRWAKKKGFAAVEGHPKGAENLRRIFDAALEMKVKYLTVWCGSFDNLTKREKIEIETLFFVYDKYLKKLLESMELREKQVRVRVLGRFKELLPEKTIKTIEDLEESTRAYDKHHLTFLIGYNGTDEMTEAVQNIVDLAAERGGNLNVGTDMIKRNLWTRDLPPVDLIIRTGLEDDPHNSAGFMMWHTAYSQYYFTDTLWPDFSAEEFKKACGAFYKKERRLGA